MTSVMTIDLEKDHRWRDKKWLVRAAEAARKVGFSYVQQAEGIGCDYKAFQQLIYKESLGEEHRQRLLEWLIDHGVAFAEPNNRFLPIGMLHDSKESAREDPATYDGLPLLPTNDFVDALFVAMDLQDHEAQSILAELHEQRQLITEEVGAMRNAFEQVYARLQAKQRERAEAAKPSPATAEPPKGKSAIGTKGKRTAQKKKTIFD